MSRLIVNGLDKTVLYICHMYNVFDASKVLGFDWDRWNLDKSYKKHCIAVEEAEEVFLDENIIFLDDVKHSQDEKRYIAVGKTLKKIPRFKTEAEERIWWQTHDSTEYVDWSKAKHVSFSNLKLSTQPITIRLPVGLIERVKIKAHKMDVPYQSLIKQAVYTSLSS